MLNTDGSYLVNYLSFVNRSFFLSPFFCFDPLGDDQTIGSLITISVQFLFCFPLPPCVISSSHQYFSEIILLIPVLWVASETFRNI